MKNNFVTITGNRKTIAKRIIKNLVKRGVIQLKDINPETNEHEYQITEFGKEEQQKHKYRLTGKR